MHAEYSVLVTYLSICDGKLKTLIGVSLSEPHTSVTALLDVCVCLHVSIYRKFKLSKQISNLHMC